MLFCNVYRGMMCIVSNSYTK